MATKYQTESPRITVYSSTVLEAWCLKSRCLWVWFPIRALAEYHGIAMPWLSPGFWWWLPVLSLPWLVAASLHVSAHLFLVWSCFFTRPTFHPDSCHMGLGAHPTVVWSVWLYLQWSYFQMWSHSEFLGITTLILSFMGWHISIHSSPIRGFLFI